MNRLTFIAIAFSTIIAQGCVSENDLGRPIKDVPTAEDSKDPGPGSTDTNGPDRSNQIPRGGEAQDGSGVQLPDDNQPDEYTNDLPRIDAPEQDEPEHPIDPEDSIDGASPEGEENEGDDDLDDFNDGAFGDSEDDGDEDNRPAEIAGECEPGGDECDEGFLCQEICQPSHCDDEGRCTQDCLLTFLCVEQ